MIEALSNSFTQTSSMRKMHHMEWPSDVTEFTHMSNTLDVSMEKLESLLKEEEHENFLRRPVIVEELDLCWFSKSRKNFISFAAKLKEMPASFYTCKFTICLLN